MGKARFDVSLDLLADLLHLPRGTTILEVGQSNLRDQTFPVYVQHDDLPEIQDGDLWPEVMPTHIRQEPIVFGGWGLEPQKRRHGHQIVTCEWIPRHQAWRLLINGRETFYDSQDQIRQWFTQREALAWFDENYGEEGTT
jgi:hypothetical protein